MNGPEQWTASRDNIIIFSSLCVLRPFPLFFHMHPTANPYSLHTSICLSLSQAQHRNLHPFIPTSPRHLHPKSPASLPSNFHLCTSKKSPSHPPIIPCRAPAVPLYRPLHAPPQPSIQVVTCRILGVF